MKVKILFILSLLISLSNLIYGQRGGNSGDYGSVISGEVHDSISNSAIEYTNIVLYKSSDSTQVTGTITNNKGEFNLKGIKTGKYYLDVQFIGFEKKRFNINVASDNSKIILGQIKIVPASFVLNNVVVQGTRNPISYQIDKKVIDPSQLSTSISGNAADVLENVPSITTDIEGNVSLRGSSSFTVLIDGRPSVMDAQDALQQIPASAIETIEIITNPSAKYDPEGNAGIINIKMKKSKNYGLSGVVNGNAGLDDKLGGDFLFEYKTSAMNYNFGVDYNRRFFPGTHLNQKQFDFNNTTSYINSNGGNERGRISLGLRGGLDFNLSNKDLLNIGARYGSRDGRRNELLNYEQWTNINLNKTFYLSRNERSRTGNYYALNLNYTRKFNSDDHQIQSEIFFSHNKSDELTLSSETSLGIQTDGKKTTESGPSNEFRGKIDYTLPFNESSKFEAGTQGEVELSKDINGLYEFSTVSNIYQFQPDFSNTVDYNRSQLAIYSIYSNVVENFGFQGGLRTEYTLQKTDLKEKQLGYKIDRWDLFPTLHTSYKFESGSQLMLSYTRRIDRPHGWELEPFQTWMDANNVRRGNPALQPEFIDSYEFGFQTFFGTVSFSNEIYYRFTHNKIERISSAYAEDVTLNTIDNVGTDYSLGSEFMVNFDPLSFWNTNLIGDLYNYRVEGTLNDKSFDKQSFTWNVRFNNSLKLTKTTQLQLNLRYRSPRVSSQERREGFFSTDLALKQDLIQKMISLTLQVRDLFKTAKFESTSTGINYYSYNYFTRQSPMVMINLKVNFNNYKSDERKQGDQQAPAEGGGGEEDF